MVVVAAGLPSYICSGVSVGAEHLPNWRPARGQGRSKTAGSSGMGRVTNPG